MKRATHGAWLAGAAALLALAWLMPSRSTPQRAGLVNEGAAERLDDSNAHDATHDAVGVVTAREERAAQPDNAPQLHDEGPGRLAHPITPEHLRIYREVDLQDAALRALRSGRFDEARSLLADHHREYPERRATDNAGLMALADCMQQPSPETRARAQSFYDEQTQSMLRRKIRQLCLNADARSN